MHSLTAYNPMSGLHLSEKSARMHSGLSASVDSAERK